MAVGTLTKSKKQNRNKDIRMPVKQTINLADVGTKPIKVYVALPAILLIIAAAALLSKFAVVDRMVAVGNAEGQVAALRNELSAANEKLAGFGELSEQFAHYTYTGMTQEELTRVDRGEVVALIQRKVIPNVVLDNWSVSGNQLSMSIIGSSLQAINMLVQDLNTEAIVDYCTVRTAATTTTSYAAETEGEAPEVVQDVQAQVVVYLTAPAEEG